MKRVFNYSSQIQNFNAHHICVYDFHRTLLVVKQLFKFLSFRRHVMKKNHDLFQILLS